MEENKGTEIVPTEQELAEAKIAQDEMNEEFQEALIENIKTLIPSKWKGDIDKMLPKILTLLKGVLKTALKSLAKELGQNEKMFVVANAPVQYAGSEKVNFRPKFYVVEMQDLKEFAFQEGKTPKVSYPIADLIDKIESYKTVESLLTDMNNGTLLMINSPVTPASGEAPATQEAIASPDGSQAQLPSPPNP